MWKFPPFFLETYSVCEASERGTFRFLDNSHGKLEYQPVEEGHKYGKNEGSRTPTVGFRLICLPSFNLLSF